MKCGNHTEAETSLKCGKCGKLICPKCMVQTPVGSRCKDCARLNLGYLYPASVRVDEWQNRENEGILYVPKAGEILYRLK